MTARVLVWILFAASLSAHGESLPESCAILPVSQGPALIRQCSRGAPSGVSEFWEPSISQILAIEQRLPEFLRSTSHSIKASDYLRQYVGVVSHGRKLIYLNAFIRGGLTVNPKKDWKTMAVIVCDGGDGFWGVEFDPADNSFHHFESNGVA